MRCKVHRAPHCVLLLSCPPPTRPNAMEAGWFTAVFKAKMPNGKFRFSDGAHTKLLCGVFLGLSELSGLVRKSILFPALGFLSP